MRGSTPRDLPELFARIGDLNREVDFARAFELLEVNTVNGPVPLQYSPENGNTVIDLRQLSASGVPAPSQIPDPTGHAGEFLFSDGAVPYWGGDAEVQTWRNRAIAAGGTFTANSLSLANSLMRHLKLASFNSKIIALWPWLGGNLATFRVPLRDALGVGISANTGFVDADCSEAHGLQGNGSSKVLDTLIVPDQLGGISGNGGIGWIENSISFAGTNTSVMGMAHNPGGGTRAFDLYLAPGEYGFEWNQDILGRPAVAPVAATNGHYYGQRSSATSRTVYKNGVLAATSAISDPAFDRSAANIMLMGLDATNVLSPSVRYWAGRSACAYLTDGTLTDPEVAAFHAMLQTYLITPTGR